VKVKLDEHIPSGAVPVLEKAGHDVHTVLSERLGGEKDDIVLAAAINEGRLLITLDRGFADVRRYPPGTHHGVLVLRPSDQQPDVITGLLHDLVTSVDLDQFDGCNVIVQGNHLRIRRPGTP
jgi:predicted nuclease of predicted toxin-antitoxin system